uniref:Conserved oligomeric Golgi complex subunit 7 n=1 Tax=Rhabditophanes sp. KR3021 TaxID=114890 RepID=A0AC35U8S0_9BILA
MKDKDLTDLLSADKCDVIAIINESSFAKKSAEMAGMIDSMYISANQRLVDEKRDFDLNSVLLNVNELSKETDAILIKLSTHIKSLKNEESKLPSSNTILVYDSAKTRTDLIAKVIKSKIEFKNACDNLKLIDRCNHKELYPVLVRLQECRKFLNEYFISLGNETEIEEMKQQFLSSHSNVISNGIESNDKITLLDLQAKYNSLDCKQIFEDAFKAFITHKMTIYVEQMEQVTRPDEILPSITDASLWKILSEAVDMWKSYHQLADELFFDKGSQLTSNSIYEALFKKWSTINGMFVNVMTNEKDQLTACLQVSKLLGSHLESVKARGDEHILHICSKVNENLLQSLKVIYQRETKSFLFSIISKIEPQDKSFKSKHKWLIPCIEDLQRVMLQLVHEAGDIFGVKFVEIICSSLETAIDELINLIINKDYLKIKKDANNEINIHKSIGEITEEKFNSIVVVGYIIKMQDSLNMSMKKTLEEISGRLLTNGNDLFLTPSQLLNKYNKNVVNHKTSAISNVIIYKMSSDLEGLFNQFVGQQEHAKNVAASLPNFSAAPHNYITTVGHSLLQILNTVTIYLNNAYFEASIKKISSKENERKKTTSSEFFLDLWLLDNIAVKCVDYFVEQIHEMGVLSTPLAKQLHADARFLIDAIVDLRLQPTHELISIVATLAEQIH